MSSFGVLICGATLLAAACTDVSSTAPAKEAARSADVLGAADESVAGAPDDPVVCPTLSERSTSALIRPDRGGTVAVDGGGIAIPPNAVRRPTRVTVTVPVSRHAVVDIEADGREHFEFYRPVDIWIDYARCPRGLTDGELDVWSIDPATATMLERFDGRDDKAARRITAESDHLSLYTLATG